MKRREFIQSIGLGAGVAPLLLRDFSRGRAAEPPPNVLLFIVEDMTTDLGCYGIPFVLSPNIDRLARESVQFEKSYCQEPNCAASRASFLTGLRPETDGVEFPYSYYFVEKILPEYGTVLDRFSQAGYHVSTFGKIHHGFDPSSPKTPSVPAGDGYYSPDNIERMMKNGSSSNLPPFESIDLPDERYYDFQIASQAIREIEDIAGSNDPFFIAIGFSKPHLPLTVPQSYLRMYDDRDIPLPRNPAKPAGCSRWALDPFLLHQYRWEHTDPNMLFSDDYTRILRKHYFACVTFVDAQIGRVLGVLRDHGLREETVIVLAADHGFHTGDLNLWGNGTLFEESLRVPLLVSDVRSSANGSRSGALVELVDLLPTMLDLAGLKIPDYPEGTSFTPLLSNPGRSWKTAAWSRQSRGLLCNPTGYSMRTDRYRYTVWQDIETLEIVERELYDLLDDPRETRNAVSLPGYEKLVDDLHAKYLAGWRSALPGGMVSRSHVPAAPPPYPWGPEGKSRREKWHEIYGGTEEDGWEKATEMRLKAIAAKTRKK